MASRRMFSKRVVDTARFLKMPSSTQNLYFHLGLNADDDGVVEAYMVLTKIGATEDDLKILVAKGFVQVLNEDLVSYITDWNENNQIRADRKIDSIYKELLLQIVPGIELKEKKPRADVKKKVVEEDGQPMDNQWTTNGQPMDGIGKDRVGKGSVGEDSVEEDSIETIKRIVDYLNMVCGTNYKYQTVNTKKHILARLSEGFTYEDFQKVIDKKSAEWTGTTMEKFLRPDTLFGSKFESYLNQNIVKDKQGNSKSGGIDWDNV